jgi:hypothetical protein
VTQLEASKLSVPAFAAQHGCHPDRLYRWRRKLRPTAPRRAAPPPPRVVPLIPVRKAPPEPARAGFELQVGPDRVLRIPAGFDAATLRALLRVLAEAPC